MSFAAFLLSLVWPVRLLILSWMKEITCKLDWRSISVDHRTTFRHSLMATCLHAVCELLLSTSLSNGISPVTHEIFSGLFLSLQAPWLAMSWDSSSSTYSPEPCPHVLNHTVLPLISLTPLGWRNGQLRSQPKTMAHRTEVDHNGWLFKRKGWSQNGEYSFTNQCSDWMVR